MTEKPRAGTTLRTVFLWISLLVVIFLAWHFAQLEKKQYPLKLSDFMAQLESGQVAEVTISGNEIKGRTTNWQYFRTLAPGGYDKILDALLAKKVAVVYQPDEIPAWSNALISSAPFILLIGFGIFFIRRMPRGGTNRLAKEFAGPLAHLAQLDELLAEVRRIRTRTIVSLVLTRGVHSEKGESARLLIPTETDVVRLQLELARGWAYLSYRAVIRTPQGDQVWGRDGLHAAGLVLSVIVEVPAKILPAAEYKLLLSGSTRAGVTEDVAEYSFSIVSR